MRKVKPESESSKSHKKKILSNRKDLEAEFANASVQRENPQSRFVKTDLTEGGGCLFCYIECMKGFGFRKVSLHQAVLDGMPHILARSLFELSQERDQKTINKFDENGRTALTIAVMEKRADLAEILLTSGANPDVGDVRSGLSPIHYATFTDSTSTVELLLANRAHPDLPDCYGMTPMMLACGLGHVLIMDVLLNAGAAIESRDSIGWTPLHYCITGDSIECLKTLLDEGADRSITDKKGLSPYDWAVSKHVESGDKGKCMDYLEKNRSNLV